jgi:hypothetical protein
VSTLLSQLRLATLPPAAMALRADIKAFLAQALEPLHGYVLVEEFLNFGAPVGSHWIADRQSAR